MKHCFKCNETKPVNEFSKNKAKKDGLQNQCKQCKSKTDRRWIENNRDKRNAYKRNKRKTDPIYKLKSNLRSRSFKAFKNASFKKTMKTSELLGTDYVTLKKYIEKQFTEGMNWGNQGEWHIDHIIPLSFAQTKEELIQLFHYKNTQPLWAEDNMKKSNKISEAFNNKW